MKYLILILSTFICTIGFTQSPDDKWFIINGLGLNPYSPNGLYFGNNVSSGSDIFVSPIKIHGGPYQNLANQWVTPQKNVLIIYDDATFYNNILSSHPIINGPSPIDQLKFQNADNTTYMYFSEKYDIPEDPDYITVSNSSSSTGSGLAVFNASPTNFNNYIWVNQDLVIGDDIIVVLNNELIFRKCRKDSLVQLCYNKISNLEDQYPVSDMLVPSPVFELSPGDYSHIYNQTGGVPHMIPIPLSNRVGSCQEIDVSLPNYTFVNFNLNPEIGLTEYIQDFNDSDMAFAVFDLYCSNGYSLSPPEKIPIRTSHDPNYIEVKSACTKADGSKWVKYHVQFQNDGSGNANEVSSTIVLPDCAIPTTYSVIDWQFNGVSRHILNSGSCAVSSSLDTLTFYFNSLGILPPEQTNYQKSIGWVEFCVKVSQNCDLETCNLMIGSPHTNFDGVDYPIHTFIDPKVPHDKREIIKHIRPVDQGCACSPVVRWPGGLLEDLGQQIKKVLLDDDLFGIIDFGLVDDENSPIGITPTFEFKGFKHDPIMHDEKRIDSSNEALKYLELYIERSVNRYGKKKCLDLILQPNSYKRNPDKSLYISVGKKYINCKRLGNKIRRSE